LNLRLQHFHPQNPLLALPFYKWKSPNKSNSDIQNLDNQKKSVSRKTSVLIAYSLGKARVMQALLL